MTALPPQLKPKLPLHVLVTAGNRPLTSASGFHKAHSQRLHRRVCTNHALSKQVIICYSSYSSIYSAILFSALSRRWSRSRDLLPYPNNINIQIVRLVKRISQYILKIFSVLRRKKPIRYSRPVEKF